jgi:formylglycine-generating enzyme required for sulfatase activity
MTKSATLDDVRLLGDYRLLKQIGQGSLGAVWVAEHRFTKKQFAIKILPEELASDRGFRARFEEEIASLASLNHPNIAKIYTVSFAGGLYFLVSECIVDRFRESTNLWHYFNAKERRLTEPELIQIAESVAGALDFAHGARGEPNRKLVHRGVKLNNILMGIDEEGKERIVLTDFGLSKIVGTGPWLTRSMKATAEALGIGMTVPPAKIGQDHYVLPSLDPSRLTPLHQSFVQNFAFLAPEQKRSDVLVDEKADIYAFGVLLYFLLMNEYPEGLFPMPSERYKDCSVNWDLVISQCLRLNAADRPSNLTLLLAEARGQAIPEKSVSEKVEPQLACDPGVGQLELFGIPPLPKKENFYEFPERIVKEYHPEKREMRNIKPLQSEMVVIPGGDYFRGSNCGCRDEMPRHKVNLASFALDIHPVTNEQFVCYLDAIGEEKDSQNHDIIKLRDSRIKKSGGRFTVEPGYARHPVVGVTWYGAVAYAQWVGKRLPTEAEWEIACCGGLENPMYPTGESIEKTEANFFSSDTTAVMSYPANQFGLYDMPGNVYEWCQDWYEYSYYEASAQEPDFPKGPLQGVYRVLRGGCWKSLKEDLRCSKRHRNNPGAANGTYGFRCAADVTP